MEPGFLTVQALSGLASASSLFVIASGLTLVFGVTRIVNFAHGSFYMLGAYIAVTVVPWMLDLDRSPWLFFTGVLVSAAAVGLRQRFMLQMKRTRCRVLELNVGRNGRRSAAEGTKLRSSLASR